MKDTKKLALDGEWRVFWNEIIPPERIGSKLTEVPAYARLPLAWNDLIGPDGKPRKAYGCATFVLNATLPRSGMEAVNIRYMASAYRLFANGRLIASNGVVSEKAAGAKPQWRPVLNPAPGISGETTFVLQVSNFHNSVGGPFKSIVIGGYQALTTTEYRLNFFHVAVFGCCLMMGFYHMTIFLFRTKKRQNLFLAVLCFLSDLKILATEKYLEILFPGADLYGFVMKMGYFTYYAAFPALTLYVFYRFPSHFRARAAYALAAIGGAFTLFSILAPVPWVQASFNAYSLYALSMFAVCAFVIARAVMAGEEFSQWVAAGFCCLLTAAVYDISHEILQFHGVNRTIYVMPIGFTLHLFIQTAIHSLNYMRSTDARRRLTRRLKAQREDLKSIVERRTRKLSEANRRLMKINEDKTVFFTTVSHELRTPLTNIRLAIESLKGLKRGQDGANTLELLDRQSSRLSALVEGVLAFARLELNRLSPILRRENLEARVGFAVASSRSLAEDKGFKIRFQRMAGYTGPIESMVDPVLFDAALNNALDNAIRHSPPGGTVTVTVGLDSGQAAIWIDDSGPGIPESELKRIFDRFYSSDPSGTGIGLTLAKGIVEAMGGSMEAANRAEGGARFAICLPLCPAPAVEAESRGEATGLAEAGNAADSLTLSADGPSAPPATSKPKARTAGTEPAGDRRRSVLVVEDDKDLLDFLIDGLSPSFRVVSASDGLEALERLRSRNDIAVIVSDVMMPRMDGRELFKRVQDDGGRPVPFIFLTAKALEEDRVQALHDGAVGYLTKPFSMEELEAKIGGMIEFSERQKDFFKQSIIAHLDSWSGTGIRAASEEKPAERPAKRSVREAAHAMGLTERQVDILSLLVKGYTDSEIATYCSISTKTVSDHVRNILEKANVDNRTQLAYELLSPGDVDV